MKLLFAAAGAPLLSSPLPASRADWDHKPSSSILLIYSQSHALWLNIMSDSRHSGVYFKMSGFCMCLNATLKIFSEPAWGVQSCSVCVCVGMLRYINMLLTSVPFHSICCMHLLLRAEGFKRGNTAFIYQWFTHEFMHWSLHICMYQ